MGRTHGGNGSPILKPKSGYWYHVEHTECVLCGSGETTRTRMYTPKPDNYADRTTYTQYACQKHFM